MTQRDDISLPLVTSAANPAVKLMRSLESRKARQTERAFLVEGLRLTGEAIQSSPSAVRLVLLRDDIDPARFIRAGIDASRIRRIASHVFDAASSVEHAQGVAAVCELPDPVLKLDVGAVGLVLVLDRLRDPGNVGTALRSAAAAGVGTVLISAGTVDPYAPKVVRAGMGAHFRLCIGTLDTHAASFLRLSGREVVYADASAPVDYHACDWRRAAAIVVGGETEPLSATLAPLVTQRVRIPMRRSMESINAGVAASVLLFEAQRQGALES